ncbi:DUF397 domain-containing protein [Streptoverticillium reticulum]|uniref:DUF397 domain-containing protein n=1 Tax=Streptoverticillium reticulum TaxID=1433415 RepID=UPI0039BF48CC
MNEAFWFKSSFSGQNGTNCVEAAWIKSSHSHENGDACVEICHPKSSQHAEKLEDPRPHIRIRDSKNPTLHPLTIPAPSWAAFVAGLRTTA